MKLIVNINKRENHLTTLSEKLEVYDQAFFAVAFLKISGLQNLIKPIRTFLKTGGQLTVVVGQNFGLTEPSALQELRNLFKPFATSKLFLAKANTTTNVFHPKLYLFKSQKDCCVITGSANLTKGGLIDNKEASVLTVCKEDNALWRDAKNFFDKLINVENSDEATLVVIKQYENYFEQQKHYNKKAKPIPTRAKSELAYNNILAKHFRKFNNFNRQENFEKKLNNYKKARTVLDEIANNPKLTRNQFEVLLDNLVGSKDKCGLWNSGSLFRLRRSVYPYFKEFRQLVVYIRDNKKNSAEIVFKNAKERVKIIEGAAVNYITEIMMTYNYKDFANMNRNPLTVLKKEGGINIKGHSSSFSGKDYEEYCEIIKEISSKLELKNMLEADSFFNEVYWKIKN